MGILKLIITRQIGHKPQNFELYGKTEQLTKSEITNALHKALDKHYKIYTFNSNKPMPRGLKGLPDHLLISYKGVKQYWLEIKLDKDTEKPDQKIFREMIERIEVKSKGAINYRLVTENNLDEVIQGIYGK